MYECQIQHLARCWNEVEGKSPAPFISLIQSQECMKQTNSSSSNRCLYWINILVWPWLAWGHFTLQPFKLTLLSLLTDQRAEWSQQTLGTMRICLLQHCQSPESWSCSPCSWATSHSSSLLSHVQCHQVHLSRGNECYLYLWNSQIQVCLHCHEPQASSKLVYEQTLPSTLFALFLTAAVPEPQASTNHRSSVLTPEIIQIMVCSPHLPFQPNVQLYPIPKLPELLNHY